MFGIKNRRVRCIFEKIVNIEDLKEVKFISDVYKGDVYVGKGFKYIM